MIALLMMALATAQTLEVRSAELQPVSEFQIDPQIWEGMHVQQILVAPEGETFAVATIVHQVQWPDGVDQWRLEDEDIALMVGQERIAAIGELDWGRFKDSGPSRRVRQSRTSPERSWHLVFPLTAVPSDAQLVIGDQQIPLALQPPIESLPPLAESVTVAVSGTEVLRSIPGVVRNGPYQGTSEYRPRSGRIVAVDVELIANASNKEIAGFFWQTTDMTLSWGDHVAAPLGQWFSDKMTRSVSHNPSVGQPPREPSRIFFVVPDGVRTASLDFHGVPVTTVTIGG